MNFVLEGPSRVPFYTDMAATLAALGIAAEAYDWYLNDLECNVIPEGFSESDQWMTGQDLQRLLLKPDLQFIWGVFSAVPIGYRAAVERAPYPDGPDIWLPHATPQLPGAHFEIICWDSSATVLIGLPEAALQRFQAVYPEVKAIVGP